jgi:three-Cys-motif partner protein
MSWQTSLVEGDIRMSESLRPEPDGLETPSVGPWSAHKHFFLRRYIDIFTNGMKNQPFELHYVDLFAGAGVEDVKGSGLDWGSPLIAAQATNRFHRLHLCELNSARLLALRTRLKRFRQPSVPQVVGADANTAVHQVVNELPKKGSLTLAFLDPHGLHLHFETIRTLATRKVDFVVFFPDNLDALRNWKIYLDQDNSNLDKVLGTTEWRSIPQSNSPDNWGEALRSLYRQQIAGLGYHEYAPERITLPQGQPLYVLMFFSRSERGGDFWRKIASTKPSGQRTFDF